MTESVRVLNHDYADAIADRDNYIETFINVVSTLYF